MIKLNTEEIKKIELDILKEIDRFCKENNKRYFLGYGTLIGAVRHKGFIPWDDDIDLYVLRDDYDWLIENYNKMNPNGRYKVIAPTDKIARHSFAKMVDTRTVKIEKDVSYKNGYLGIDVDLFPIDGCPDDERVYAKWYKQLMKIYKKHYYFIISLKGSSLKYRLWVLVNRLLGFSKNHQIKKAKRLHAKYPLTSAKRIRSMECLWENLKAFYDSNSFDKSVQLDFEGFKFDAPAEYDYILTKTYGDYMTLPPKDQQVTHHANECYLKAENHI